mmetsp:Transcript_40078/g.94190  ORF Transcript_40078/g.94190 Transcript_40078/m.94190 type:complete len:174 (-) Transcript_40078:1149-1670(-)
MLGLSCSGIGAPPPLSLLCARSRMPRMAPDTAPLPSIPALPAPLLSHLVLARSATSALCARGSAAGGRGVAHARGLLPPSPVSSFRLHAPVCSFRVNVGSFQVKIGSVRGQLRSQDRKRAGTEAQSEAAGSRTCPAAASVCFSCHISKFHAYPSPSPPGDNVRARTRTGCPRR